MLRVVSGGPGRKGFRLHCVGFARTSHAARRAVRRQLAGSEANGIVPAESSSHVGRSRPGRGRVVNGEAVNWPSHCRRFLLDPICLPAGWIARQSVAITYRNIAEGSGVMLIAKTVPSPLAPASSRPKEPPRPRHQNWAFPDTNSARARPAAAESIPLQTNGKPAFRWAETSPFPVLAACIHFWSRSSTFRRFLIC
jgi:hypothetical protein